jgi:hypothetical protein
MNSKVLDFYDAVTSDNGLKVQDILKDNLFAESKIPVRIIAGMLVIAIENKYVNAGKAILHYNTFSHEKISDMHLNAIICLAAKNDMLSQLKITYH